MGNPEIEREARKTLKQILEFIGADLNYADYAQLVTYMEWFRTNTKGMSDG